MGHIITLLYKLIKIINNNLLPTIRTPAINWLTERESVCVVCVYACELEGVCWEGGRGWGRVWNGDNLYVYIWELTEGYGMHAAINTSQTATITRAKCLATVAMIQRDHKKFRQNYQKASCTKPRRRRAFLHTYTLISTRKHDNARADETHTTHHMHTFNTHLHAGKKKAKSNQVKNSLICF